MNKDIALVMPAAGRGSRFAKFGILEPKPLIDLHGRPFFWWATESVRRSVKLRQLVYVVLEEHITEFNIDQRIKAFYPEATIVAIPDVTSGAAETARIGVQALVEPGPVAINDCDHAFMSSALPATVAALQADLAGGLMCFQSSNPAYSYVKLGASGAVEGTVEKKVVSPYAIAGCYLFGNSADFDGLYARYQQACPYDELFISGIYDLMAQDGLKLDKVELDRHISFGTPDELGRVSPEAIAPFLAWK